MVEGSGGDFEAILTELTQVTEELLATPESDSERRLELQARRERLRTEASRMGAGPARGTDGPPLRPFDDGKR